MKVLVGYASRHGSTEEIAERIGAGDLRGRCLLKLDVQGFELSALRGCSELLPRFAHVYVEASFVELYEGQALASQVVGHLFAEGFNLTCVANPTRGKSRKPIQADFLFSRP